VIKLDKYEILGLSSIILFILNFNYYLFFDNFPEAFNLCYLTLIILGIGLLMNNRLSYSIGAFFVIFPIIQVLFRIIGLLSYDPRLFSFWLILEISIHAFLIIIAVIGFKKFQNFYPRTWLVASLLAIIIWFLTFFLNTSEINVNYTLKPPVFLEFLGLWGFFAFSAILTTTGWFLLNYYFSETRKK